MKLDFNNIINFILNYIFISVPQTAMITLLILFLIKEYDYFKRKNFKKTLLDVLFRGALQSAFFMNYTFYFTEFNLGLRAFINSLIYLAFINQILKSTKKSLLWKEHLKLYSNYGLNEKYNPNEFKIETNKYVFMIKNDKPKFKYKNKIGIYKYIIIMMVALFIMEISMVFYLQYIFRFDVGTITSNILNSIWISCPEFILLAFGIYLGFLYVNTKEANILKMWKTNKKFRITTYVQLIITFIFTLIVYMFVVRDNLLYSLNINIAFKIAIGFYVLLLLHIIIPLGLNSKKSMK